MIFIQEDERPPDTYEHVRVLADTQIANEQAVRDELDAIESDLTELWDDYYDIPYGTKYSIRIRVELPGNVEKQLHKLLYDDLEIGDSDEELIMVLVAMTDGIYIDDKHVHKTDTAFWENPANWNMRKVEAILISYFGRLKEERKQTYSFPGPKTTESTDTNQGDGTVK